MEAVRRAPIINALQGRPCRSAAVARLPRGQAGARCARARHVRPAHGAVPQAQLGAARPHASRLCRLSLAARDAGGPRPRRRLPAARPLRHELRHRRLRRKVPRQGREGAEPRRDARPDGRDSARLPPPQPDGRGHHRHGQAALAQVDVSFHPGCALRPTCGL
uniref:Uncharacterized protein n=1 Tax=Emiliania huxleyi (strain CCMP1516) TaxID=280463 RepID=A0A0D3L2E4_EMIH1